MLPDGPIQVGVLVADDGLSYTLEIKFNKGFQVLSVAAQGTTFRSYVLQIQQDIEAMDADSHDAEGAMIIFQVLAELLPHIEAGDLELEETLSVDVRADINLMNLLS